VEFPGNPLNDTNQALVGLAWGHSFEGRGSPVLFASLYGASESAENEAVTNIGGVPTPTEGLADRDYWGLRVGGQYSLDERVDLVASLLGQFSDYNGVHPSYNDREREDDFYHLSVGADYQLTPRVLIRPRLVYSNNDSNVPISDYDRWQAYVTARYTF
jgi:hypothetical protein